MADSNPATDWFAQIGAAMTSAATNFSNFDAGMNAQTGNKAMSKDDAEKQIEATKANWKSRGMSVEDIAKNEAMLRDHYSTIMAGQK